MARLYRYADSSDKSGYFLVGASEGENYTMGVTTLGRRLFDRMGFQPGVQNRNRGPRVPSQLQWAMYNVGLLKTGDREPSESGFDGEFDVEDAAITEEMMVELEEFVLQQESTRREIQELAEILDIEPNTESQTPIWEISGEDAEILTGMFKGTFNQEICTEDAPNWNIDVVHKPNIPEIGPSTTFNVNIEHPSDEEEKYTYQIVYISDDVSDIPAVTTMTKEKVDAERRVRIDRHRGRVLEAMTSVPQLADFYAGNPTEDVSVIILEEVLD